jgi:glycosyltransferase involved in cell wall biosynthesis
MSHVAVVLATRNSMPHLTETLASIRQQTRTADALIAIDDHSNDDTIAELRDSGFEVVTSTSTDVDSVTRIARNFVHGLRIAHLQEADVVILGDHDDTWHVDRLEHQVEMLEKHQSIAMVASDGYLIDSNGVALPGTIRGTFPVPDEFDGWSVRQQVQYALRHSIATGGASAMRPSHFTSWVVPPGWLHDRWWSLNMLRRGMFMVDRTAVIDYRITEDQEVGLATGDQDRSLAWWLSRSRDVPRSARRMRDLASLLRS